MIMDQYMRDVELFNDLGTSDLFPVEDVPMKVSSQFVLDDYFDALFELIKYVWAIRSTIPDTPELELKKRHLLELYNAMSDLVSDMKNYCDRTMCKKENEN